MAMRQTVVIGAQWGDEGKGKLVDAFSSQYDAIGRFNGGNNAGHTIIYKGEQVKLHTLPSGIFSKKKLLIAQGAVFDPEVLVSELEFCLKNKLKIDLLIDYRVNLVMPYHKLMDGAHEAWKGKKATGSVKVGIGYCYEDRNNRSGVRCEDLLYPKLLKEKISTIFPLKKAMLEKVYGARVEMTVADVYEKLARLAKYFTRYIGDVNEYVYVHLKKKKMLWEGAMATMLDGQFGTYPYTVANNTLASSLYTSVGLPAFPIQTIGVVKAYTTRVGGGPFPTEQKNSAGDTLQKVGREIAATSGRIRRCGWLDLPVVRFANRLNDFSELAVTKLDVLSVFDKIPVCVQYQLGKKKLKGYPAVSHEYYSAKPIYKILKGWKKPLTGIKKYGQLPKEAKAYISFIEKEVGVKVTYVSIGAEREALLKK